ncbi:hydantoinase/oxoprolinase family protein [Acuticoccus mangrovi]|uniref:Hydantoinase/oxoprolinase family protein n=1 Tax=Acuticoccus mangrovi TaxID=2796142 RepID=A0A934IIH1_9HYPH|nr:hydantoinase/oxoprolinase family protein [Acuticoccus mangrovi]MBJ3777093.1 hydantoinase/oxoprolinase family protein [Acuticoccus mangrovi]
MSTTYTIGIDVGGTFTDFVAIDPDGATVIAKSLSTPEDQSIGVLAGLEELAARLDLSTAALLGRTERIVHGTTVATNAMLERKGAKVGLLTTAGHRDILEMREGLKPERYNLLMAPPEPLVPRALRRGVPERIAHDGTVAQPLDEAAVRREVEHLRERGVTSVAICFLHAYRNAAHEARAAEIVAEMMPEAYVSVSSAVLPQIKEYERLSTTVVNAAIGPVVKRYMQRLTGRLAEAGFDGPLFVILSHGGITQVADAIALAAGTCLSGPAGGIAGARACADLIGERNVIPFDMGGTSTEISLIADGRVALTSERGLAGERIALRSYDIHSIGAGGGSLASPDGTGSFTVGPRSAGAVPGPACYGQGGTEATVTDSNLVLGYLADDAFAGGRGTLDRAAAEAAIDDLAGKIGLDRIGTAVGIHRLINVKMADGIRLMTLRRGVDPRNFTIVAFGGAAGLHAAEVAREIGVTRVVVPTIASVLCAWGMLASDLRYEVARSRVGDSAALSDTALRALFDELEADARARLPDRFAERLRIERSAEMRYGEQIFEINVPLDGIDFAAPGLADAVVDRFHRRHEDLYTYSSPGQDVDLVNARVAVVGEVERGDAARPLAPATRPIAPVGARTIHTGGRFVEAPVFAFEAMAPGHRIDGPALIESETTTVALHAGDRVSVTAHGWLDIAVAPKVDVLAEADAPTQPAIAD